MNALLRYVMLIFFCLGLVKAWRYQSANVAAGKLLRKEKPSAFSYSDTSTSLSCNSQTTMQSDSDNPHSSIKIIYRNARKEDLQQIASLCVDVFEGPFNFLQQLQKQWSILNTLSQLQDRYGRFIEGGRKHAMVVATGEENQVVGFVEIGMLPSPVESQVEINNVSILMRYEVPYLGNVAVSTAYRRRGIASKLITIASKVVEKWRTHNNNINANNNNNSLNNNSTSSYLPPSSTMQRENVAENSLYVAVEVGNRAAICLYERLGFTTVVDERTLNSNNYLTTEKREEEKGRREARLYLKKTWE